jgi:hypothetical protein
MHDAAQRRQAPSNKAGSGRTPVKTLGRGGPVLNAAPNAPSISGPFEAKPEPAAPPVEPVADRFTTGPQPKAKVQLDVFAGMATAKARKTAEILDDESPY